jgi:hypothetical protein
MLIKPFYSMSIRRKDATSRHVARRQPCSLMVMRTPSGNKLDVQEDSWWWRKNQSIWRLGNTFDKPLRVRRCGHTDGQRCPDTPPRQGWCFLPFCLRSHRDAKCLLPSTRNAVQAPEVRLFFHTLTDVNAIVRCHSLITSGLDQALLETNRDFSKVDVLIF